jgi:hypothetical protein
MVRNQFVTMQKFPFSSISYSYGRKLGKIVIFELKNVLCQSLA